MRTVKTDKGEVTYDDDMKIGALRGFFASVNSGDFEALISSLSSIVHEWEYDGDPQDEAAWDELRLSDFQAITSGIMADLGGLGEASGAN